MTYKLATAALIASLCLGVVYSQTPICTKSCLNSCQSSIKECLTSCKCDELMSDSSNSTVSIESLDEQEVANLRHNLFNARDSWISYRREYNQLKKNEKKYRKMQNLYQEYLENASKAFIDVDECDMHCAHACVNERNNIDDITDCMVNTCSCSFVVNADQLVEKYEQTKQNHQDMKKIDKNHTVIEDTNASCNVTCTSQCDKVKEVLEERFFINCMTQRCRCSYEEVESYQPSQSTLVLATSDTKIVTKAEKTSSAELVIYAVTIGAVILSLILGVIVLNMPDRQLQKVQSNVQEEETILDQDNEDENLNQRRDRNSFRRQFQSDEVVMMEQSY